MNIYKNTLDTIIMCLKMFSSRHVFIILSLLLYEISGSGNVCKNYLDYYLMLFGLGSSCYHSDDIFANTPDMLQRHTKAYETYSLTTEDGYILTMFRIPRQNPKGVVLLQHPVTTDSIVWVGQGNESLAILMWEAGYDVWLPNQRGTYFSEKHTTLSSEDLKYWDFSYHEIGMYDLPATIKFIKEKTGQSKLIFIGHSMSTSSSIAFASLQPDVAKSGIQVFIEMSPVCYFTHVRSPAQYISLFRVPIITFFRVLNIGYLLKYHSITGIFFKLFVLTPFQNFVVIMISIMVGWTPDEFDPKLVNIALSQNPRGAPWKLVNHYSQQVTAGGKYQMFDYGTEKNMQLYNQSTPPEYPVGNINVPVYLIYSPADSCATVKDSELLYSKLSDKAKIYGKLEVSGLNHIDFHYGKHRRERVFDNILKLLDKIH